MHCTGLALAGVLLCGTAAARTIDVEDYFAVGSYNKWRYHNIADNADRITIAVKATRRVAGVRRYSFQLPLDEAMAILVFGFDGGDLRLYRLKVTLGELAKAGVDLPAELDISNGIAFDPPLRIGGNDTVLGVSRSETPVNTRFPIRVKVGPFETDIIDVTVTGTVAASWRETASVSTPLGVFDDVALLTIDVALRFQAGAAGYNFDERLTEAVAGVLARDVGFVEVTSRGAVFRVVKAILSGRTLGDFEPNEDIVELRFPLEGPLRRLSEG